MNTTDQVLMVPSMLASTLLTKVIVATNDDPSIKNPITHRILETFLPMLNFPPLYHYALAKEHIYK